MPTHVALLRGVNIGPSKRIAMADLRALMESLDHTDIATYVNSGNVVFNPPKPGSNEAIAAGIHAALVEHHGLDVGVIVRTAAELHAVIDGNPFPDAAAIPKTLHVAFLDREPEPGRVAALASVNRGDDDYRIAGDVAYLHYRHGIGKAIFMPKGLDRALGVTTTARNWNTVCDLAEMTKADG
jgi:uncharacterized protein (DUF1697 family)